MKITPIIDGKYRLLTIGEIRLGTDEWKYKRNKKWRFVTGISVGRKLTKRIAKIAHYRRMI